jgi:hypothetical protein
MPKPTYSNVTASLALFLALGGTSYAIGRASVGTPQLKDGAVTSSKIRDRSVRRRDLASDAVIAGARGPRGREGPAGLATPADLATQVSNPYVFRAHALATQDTPSDGAVTVVLGGKDFDPHGDFNTVSSQYAAPVSGYYFFSARVDLCCNPVRAFLQIAGRDSATRGMDLTSSTGVADSGTVGSGLMHLSQGEPVRLDVYTSSVDTIQAGPRMLLSGYLVAAG